MSSELPGAVEQWRQGGRMVDTPDGRIFVRWTDGDGPPVVFLHGYPSSSYDFRQMLARLPGRATLTLDFLGFGLSDKPRPFDYRIFTHADHVERVIADHVDGTVDVVAHDMGTSVATELMARAIADTLGIALRRVILSNGGVIIERASLRPIQRALLSPLGPVVSRLANPRMFRHQFGKVFSSGHPLDPQEAAEQWALIAHADGHRIAHLLCQYVRERTTYAGRWHGAVEKYPGDLAFMWGMRDPVATAHVLAGLRELRPAAPVVELPDLGHYPQLEDPDAVASAVVGLLN